MQIAADYLKKFAWKIISGDSPAFNKVYEYVESKAKIAAVESNLVKADLLWQNDQRDEAVKIYGKYHNELNEVRLKKLEYWKSKQKNEHKNRINFRYREKL
jgi:hypothetical protein